MPSSSSRSMGGAEWLLLIALSVLWGGSFLFGKVAVGEIPPLSVTLGRVALAAVALNLLLLVLGQRLPTDRVSWLAFIGMGFLNNVLPFTLIFWGQMQIGAGLASILNATTPLWTVVVAHLLTSDEKMNAGKLAGVLLGIAGVAALIGPSAVAGFSGDVPAMIAVVLATLSYAFAGIFGRRFARMGLAPLSVATGQVTAATIMMLPLALAVDRPWLLAPPGTTAIAALVGLAVISTALAYVIYFRLLATAGATNLLLVTFLIPPSALAFGMLLLDEPLLSRHVVGLVLIGGGLVAIDGRLWRRVRAAKEA
ncbi:DMT family transporter [Reyranella sp. CPCC 100927]|uniref:DMT family transporter n=1 Tax=Reyranella sp. CPCC 100927 TaxID=2599616 RepID=UPI0011B5A4FB|nr:DMT family transporter [Reyranella sp. CPCC 100927]TWT14875.1 DMT family transporter [Reyranella sp. CPCC 100927]